MSEIVQTLLEIMESPVYVQGYLTVYIQQLSVYIFISGLADALYQIVNLQNLTLVIDGKNNQINERGAYGLRIGLANNIALTSLKLSLFNNQIREQGASCFGIVFGNHLNLIELQLQFEINQISEAGTFGIANGISYCVNLASLELILSCITNSIRTQQFEKIYQSITGSQQVKIESFGQKNQKTTLAKAVGIGQKTRTIPNNNRIKLKFKNK
ncbi:hypothetical protein ABPG72_022428 [Tetrahymena utriculariae]